MLKNDGNELKPGESLHATGGQGKIYSLPNSQGVVYALDYQFDGNLVIYKNDLKNSCEAISSARSNVKKGVFFMSEFINDSNSAVPCFNIVHENIHPVDGSYYVTQCHWPAIKNATLKITDEGKLIQIGPDGRVRDFDITSPIFSQKWETVYSQDILP